MRSSFVSICFNSLFFEVRRLRNKRHASHNANGSTTIKPPMSSLRSSLLAHACEARTRSHDHTSVIFDHDFAQPPPTSASTSDHDGGVVSIAMAERLSAGPDGPDAAEIGDTFKRKP